MPDPFVSVRPRRSWLVLLVLGLGLLTLPVVAIGTEAAAAGTRVRLSAPSETYTGREVRLSGGVRGLARGFVRIQARRGGSWRTVDTARLRRGDFRATATTPSRPGTFVVRASVSRRRGSPTLAASRPRSVDVVPEVSFDVPQGTRVLRPDPAVWSFVPGSTPDTVQAYVEDPSLVLPPAGGYLVLGTAPGLPAGMISEVVSAQREEYGWSLVLAPAPLDEALDAVSINQGGEVVPDVVDARGRIVDDATVSREPDGAITLRPPAGPPGPTKGAPRARRGFGATASAWECTSGGLTKDPQDLWEALFDNGVPIEVTFDNSFPTHVFEGRDLDVSLKSDIRTSVGFNARGGFACELSSAFRRNHRLRFPIGSIGPVPVSLTLEPMLTFEVSAGGRIEWVQTHRVVTSLRKHADEPLTGAANVTTTAPSRTVTTDATMNVFFGGDLALMLGGGSGPVGAEAGVYGSFGPQLALNYHGDSPGCLYPQGRLRADLGVRLRAWVGSWSESRELTLTSLTTPWRDLTAPLCALPGGSTPQRRARLTWDSGWDLDLHIWDAQGRHAYFAEREAIPESLLLRDVIEGYGPEDFEEDSEHGRGYTYGVCSYSTDEVTWESAYTLEVWEPDGSLRTVTGSLDFRRDADYVTASGSGSVQPWNIAKGWCDPDYLDEPDDYGD